MSKQKISIDWLSHELMNLSFDYLVGQVNNKEYGEIFDKIMQQAKEMYEQEIHKAYEQANEMIEISDDEIDKGLGNADNEPYIQGWKDGIKWYKEQLKSK